jgi:hypothetical protein
MARKNSAKKQGLSKKDAKKLVSLSRKNRSISMISVKDAR